MGYHVTDLLAAASAASIPVVQGVTDEDFPARTPCSEFDVKGLLNHLFQVVVNFQSLAAREAADFSATPDYLSGDWRERYAEETAKLVTAWSDPSSLEGVSPGMGLPQLTVAHMALLDLTVHSWDLAHSTGQVFTPAPGAVTALLGFVAEMGPMARKMGVFGEAFDVPGNDFERLLGATGRNPVAPRV